jgi:very-short-patch-repair endonuclease
VDPADRFGRHDVLTRRDLIARGATVTEIAAAVHAGRLIRIRRGHYGRPGMDAETERAVRVGGVLSCVSELRRRGVWVLPAPSTHVQLAPNAARLRDPDDRARPYAGDFSACTLHWSTSLEAARSDRAHASVVDALALAMRCLSPTFALAALDSAVHLRLVTLDQLRGISARLPQDHAALIERIDPRAESGIETIIRDVAVRLGFRVASQPFLVGTGRGDLLIEDCVLVEADGGEFHGAEVTTRDRRRDAAFTISGKTVLHFRYAQVLYERRMVAEAIIAAVASHRGIRNSGRLAARARRRLESLDLS